LDFTAGVLDPRVTITRALNTATRINSSGLLEVVNANLPRFDFNPTTLVSRGLLIEEARQNLFLNSLIDGTNLTTQSVTLTAAAHTLSFYGTGSVVISGGHTATLAGTGNYPTRTTLTFTPTAGSSTFTVTGEVKFAQIELGAFATSFIPTAGTSVQRNADVATMTSTNFTSWFNASEGAFSATYSRIAIKRYSRVFAASNVAESDQITLISGLQADGRENGNVQVASVQNILYPGNTPAAGQVTQFCLSYKTGSSAASLNASTVSTSSAAFANPAPTQFNIGSIVASGQYLNGHVQKVMYWPQDLTDAEVRAFSKL
jgi:hypothetical protein